MKIISVASARPNFMKVAPLLHAFKESEEPIDSVLVHTGQHYDYEMSKIFFDELGLPEPDHHLGIGSGSHAEQTGRVMIEFEKVLLKEKPDWVVVVGDVNPTMACTITANKLGIRVAHVEAGLRSGDRTMPEEINRILTDAIADLLLTPSPGAGENLKKEGIPGEKIRFVGNIMIDTLFRMREKAQKSTILEELGLKKRNYLLVTLHRPSNVDRKETLEGYMRLLAELSDELPVVFPVHPRTRNRAEEFGIWEAMQSKHNLHLLEPVGYLDNIALMEHARLVLTDSGGIQEETTALGVPCLTARENTERPITVTEGTNRVAGADPEKLGAAVRSELEKELSNRKPPSRPELWDGQTRPSGSGRPYSITGTPDNDTYADNNPNYFLYISRFPKPMIKK
ncbi:MAG: UDP-N-acetylglucosamine 2-epimerase (non-hydrolyzing) [Balneolaceae bacterium]|nr:UDP-N-acetylglucosamine 2-epimerase (non-hydrolyzing) [Balneolaceae bacterium]